jgi:oligoendopeptidase F
MFKAMHRFDYTPEHCYAFHDGIQKVIIPLLEKMLTKRKANMTLDTLKPWDGSCDPFNREPLEPFETEEEFISGVTHIFRKIDPKLADQFDKMNDLNLLDLMSRKGKAPGGYQSGLEEIRVPFIFMNAVGVDDNLRVLIHEGGHAFHSFAAADEPLVDYRHAPIEFCEVASMGMELLAIDHYTEFYEADEAQRSKEDSLESIITVLAWIATIDCFQHWVYENPTHTPQERKVKWLEIHNKFGGQFTDWDNTGESHNYAWHRQLHLFECPFYYIEYGIAQLGALGLWVQAKGDKTNALKNYHNGLSLGGSKRLPELFEATGLPFDFSQKTIEPLAQALADELGLS